MERAKKEQLVADLSGTFGDAAVVVVTHQNGLSVAESTDLRRRMRSTRPGDGRRRRKPYVFKFKSPDKTYALSLSFRQQEVDRGDLIRALEETLQQLRAEASN